MTPKHPSTWSAQEHLDHLNSLERKSTLYLALSIMGTIVLLGALAGLSYGIFFFYGTDLIMHAIFQALIIGRPMMDMIQGYSSNAGLPFVLSAIPMKWRAALQQEMRQYFSLHSIQHQLNGKSIRLWSKEGIEAALCPKHDKAYGLLVEKELTTIDAKCTRIEEEIYYTKRAYTAVKGEETHLLKRLEIVEKTREHAEPRKARSIDFEIKAINEQLDRCTSLKRYFKHTLSDFEENLKPLHHSWKGWVTEAQSQSLQITPNPDRTKDGTLSSEKKQAIRKAIPSEEKEAQTKQRLLHLTNHIAIPKDPQMSSSKLVSDIVQGRVSTSNAPSKPPF